VKRTGPKRLIDPTIPRHIDQSQIPTGVYWDRRRSRWYQLYKKDDGARGRRDGPDATARIADLHAFAEKFVDDEAGTIRAVMKLFHASAKFRGLAQATRKGYEQCRQWIIVETTADGGSLADATIDRLTRQHIQRRIDKISEATPSKANAILRYLRRTLRWGQNRGHCRTNPAEGVELAEEKKKASMPESDAVFIATLTFAQACARLPAHTEGSVPAYLPLVMELAYLCRLRGVEALDLTLASACADGLTVSRRKGSRSNLVEWNPRLRAVWDSALAERARTLARKQAQGVVVPIEIDPGKRRVFLAESGAPLTRSGLSSAWQRFMAIATDPVKGCITPEQRFTLHGVKHRGITDTPGTRAEKQDAAGHVDPRMTERYDHSVPRVKPARE
jgi:site-specific recombinase XerD